MSVKSSKLHKPSKLASYGIDILAVYSSVNETPVPLEEAMVKIQKLISGKSSTTKLQIRKGIFQIWSNNSGLYSIVIKAHNNKQILENFSVNSIGTPQVGQLATQSLVFLPVLSKDHKSELFVFHPNTATAQEIVIRLVKLIQLKDMINSQSLRRSSPSPPKSEQGEMIRPINIVDDPAIKRENGDSDDIRSEYSLSSTFFNNWYSKVENMVSMTPNSLYQSSDYGPSINDELYLLNHNLREIRAFMNNLYVIMHKAVSESNIRNGPVDRIVKLPSRASFIEIVRKVKSSLNMASIHETIITNPSSKDIVNQLLLILKILCDATVDKTTGIPDMIMSIKDPFIKDPTVKYLTENLNTTNKEFWISMGENYGHIQLRDLNPIALHRTVIDEFEIRRDLLSPNYDGHTNRSYERSPDRIYDRNPNIMSNERNTDRSYTDKSHENKYYRNYSSDNDVSSEDLFMPKKLTLSQPQLNYSEPLRSVPIYDDDLIYRSYPHEYNIDGHVAQHPYHSPMIQQKSVKVSPNLNGHRHINNNTWNDKQCRFIDAVRLRNGRLMRVTRDRSAQNHREIPVSCNEVVELLTDYGDMLSVMNALGEVGHCPSSIVENTVD